MSALNCNCQKPCNKTICCSVCNEASNCESRCPTCAPKNKEQVKVEEPKITQED